LPYFNRQATRTQGISHCRQQHALALGVKIKIKLAKRIEKLDSLRSKMKAKYGGSNTLVIDLDKEIVEARAILAVLKNKTSLDRGQ
jgi:hypothetical protein